MRERKAAAKGDRARGRAPSGSCIAGRILGPAETHPDGARAGCATHPALRPNVPTRQFEARSCRPGVRDPGSVARASDLRAAACPERGRAEVELPRRADHGQQPDGRPPRLGPGLQGPLPAVPRHARRGRAVPERVRLPGTVGRGQRRARARVHLEARHRGVRDRPLRDPLQAARPDLRGPPDRAVGPARDVDGLERPRRAAPARRAARRGALGDRHHRRRGRPGHRHRRDARRAARHAGRRRQLLHLQQREQRPHLGLPGRVPPARLDLQGPRHDAVVRAVRNRDLPDRDERGLPGPRGSGADRHASRFATDPASRSWCGRRRRGR